MSGGERRDAARRRPRGPALLRECADKRPRQARLGDLATCTGYALKDVIVEGAATILVNARYATRVKIKLWHEGAITTGSPDVMFGGPTITPAEIIEKAKERAKQILKCAQNRLNRWNEEDKAMAKTWFGSDSDAVRDTLKNRVANAKFDDRQGGLSPRSGGPAVCHQHQHQQSRHVCARLLDRHGSQGLPRHPLLERPDQRHDNQTGALLHEMSHFEDVGDTDDVTRPEGMLPRGRRHTGRRTPCGLPTTRPATP